MVCRSENTVFQFRINVDGSLNPLLNDRITLRNEPSTLVIDARGKFLFVAYKRTRDIDKLVIDQDGKLGKQISGTTYRYPVSSLTVSPESQYVYAVMRDHTFVRFQEDINGNLAEPIIEMRLDEVPSAIIFSKHSHFAYIVNNRGSTISQYQISAEGVAVALKPSEVSTTDKPISVSAQTTPMKYVSKNTGPNSIALDITGKYAYVGNNDGSISFYHINSDGTLLANPISNTIIGKSISSMIIVSAYTNHL